MEVFGEGMFIYNKFKNIVQCPERCLAVLFCVGFVGSLKMKGSTMA